MTQDNTMEQLDKYYKLNLIHLSLSFWASIGALGVGLVALLAGVAFIYFGETDLTSALSVIGGVLSQFIGAGFFFIYSRNLRQLNVFYENLTKHKDTLYAISLAREIEGPDKYKALMAVIGNLLSRGEPPMDPEVLKAFAPAPSGSDA
jgi:hypothetical protein